MSILTLVIAVFGVAVAGLALRTARRSAAAAERSAFAAEASANTASAEDLRARTPDLEVEVPNPAYPNDNIVMFCLRNVGPQDLDSVVIHQPDTDDALDYAIAAADVGMWANRVDIGALALNERAEITLRCGPAVDLPTFRLRIECSAGNDQWAVSRTLPRVNRHVAKAITYRDDRLRNRR
jgi:hypothetical protein